MEAEVIVVIRPPSFRLNSGLGRSCRSAAIATSSSRSRGIATSAAPSRISWIARPLTPRRPAMRPPPLPRERLDGAELQLLDGALAAAELPRHVGDAALLGEARHEHVALRARQRADEAEEEGTALDVVERCRLVRVVQRHLPLRLPRAVAEDVARDGVEPRHERSAALLVPVDAFQRLVENLGDHVLRLPAPPPPPRPPTAHALEVLLVELGELRSLVHRHGA